MLPRLQMRLRRSRRATRTSLNDKMNAGRGERLMKRPNWYRVIATLCAVLIFAFLVTMSQRHANAAPPSEGGIAGTVKLEGTAPHQRPIDMSKEPACAAVHKANPVTTENVVAGSDGGLKNVVVYISEGWSGSPEAVSATPTWDQKGCQYIPHVMGLDVNQHFKVTNSDPTSHNIHPMPKPGGPNHEWNKSQPSGAP